MSEVDVSVIVPAYRADRTLGRCLESILAQEFPGRFELVLVASADRRDALPAVPPDDRVRVITNVPRLSAAVARNLGAREARGRLLAFTDADVVPGRGWLAALARASREKLCVAGAVLNGTPESAIGTTEYLVQFLDLHPRRPPRTAWHGATANLLLPRALWERAGPFPQDMDGGEDTFLTTRLRQCGLFSFAPEAPVVHLNRTDARAVVRHQFTYGRFTAQLGRRDCPYRFRPLIRHWFLAPVAAAGRVVSLYARALAWLPGSRRRVFALAPLIVPALGAFGAGLLSEGLRLAHGRR